MKTRPSRSATASPTVDFPAPEIPTRIRWAARASVAKARGKSSEVAITISPELLEGIAAELLDRGLRDDERHHCLGDHTHCRHSSHITPLRDRLRGAPRGDVDRLQRTHQGADRLHRDAKHERLPGRDPPLEPPC